MSPPEIVCVSDERDEQCSAGEEFQQPRNKDNFYKDSGYVYFSVEVDTLDEIDN